MGVDTDPGITPRAIEEVFRCIEEHPNAEYLVRVSYIEIYQEQLKDLFNPQKTPQDLIIMEDRK
jgi:centromeric protein E